MCAHYTKYLSRSERTSTISSHLEGQPGDGSDPGTSPSEHQRFKAFHGHWHEWQADWPVTSEKTHLWRRKRAVQGQSQETVQSRQPTRCPAALPRLHLRHAPATATLPHPDKKERVRNSHAQSSFQGGINNRT